MKLEEATEILTLDYKLNSKRWSDNRCLALKLGIEALKRCKEARKRVYFTTRSLLPGETE